MNPVLVIGSNSFSGASMCAHLLQSDQPVIGVSRSELPHSALLPYQWNKKQQGFEFHQLDLNHQLPEIINLIKRHKIRYIYNFAAQSMVAQSWDYPEHWFTTNVTSTIRLHHALKNLDHLEKYIHISTPEVYGGCTHLLKENNHYCPSTPYAVSRAAADMSLHTFFNTYQFPVVFTRAANVYGAGQQLYRIIPKCILSVLLAKRFLLHGGGHSVRSFIHIDDVARATQLIAEKGRLGEVYHIATEYTISIRTLVEKITDMLGATVRDCCDVSEDRPGKDSAYLLDSAKLREELNWCDEIGLEQGLLSTIDWAKSNIQELQRLPDYYIHKA